jgi:hypothetical protein
VGLPTWLKTRERCGLKSNFSTFDELKEILSSKTVKLLKENYDSVVDIDLYVGGALESFAVLDKTVLGPTFSCITRDQYRRISSGDAYYFSHPNSPYPFTPAQLQAINNFSLNNWICSTTNVQSVNKNWIYVDSENNPKVPCSQFPKIDLNPWKEK